MCNLSLDRETLCRHPVPDPYEPMVPGEAPNGEGYHSGMNGKSIHARKVLSPGLSMEGRDDWLPQEEIHRADGSRLCSALLFGPRLRSDALALRDHFSHLDIKRTPT